MERVRVGRFSISTSLLIRAALTRGLSCTYLPERVVQISDSNSTQYFRGTNLPCNNVVASHLSHNKYFLRRVLKEAKLPTPHTVVLRHPAAWKTVVKSSLRFPLVVKPINAAHAQGASLNITTPNELKHAVARAFAYNKKNKKESRVLVEEYFSGVDLRLLVVGKRVVSAVKREPAYVVGDGKSTILKLIRDFNEEWYSPIKYDLPLCPIPIDSEVSRCLRSKNLKLTTILPQGQKTHVRWNANVSTGGRSIDVTNQIHPSFNQLAIRIAELSHLEIGGVDILCKDYTSKDMSGDNVAILEINDAPGFDIHHFPFTGKGRNICDDILSHIFRQQTSEPELLIKEIETVLGESQPSVPKEPKVVSKNKPNQTVLNQIS